jgi:hypothetical protein
MRFNTCNIALSSFGNVAAEGLDGACPGHPVPAAARVMASATVERIFVFSVIPP